MPLLEFLKGRFFKMYFGTDAHVAWLRKRLVDYFMSKEYLRLDSQFISVAAFWKPETPEEVMTGTLTVNDDGICFVTSPEYSRGGSGARSRSEPVEF